ncbi:hypothetical protein FB2170_11856 [Maribacter sp. HTCC2170]|nr:hypothetical protein FB2170_11856 [Maribacter sp. HTCC2170]
MYQKINKPPQDLYYLQRVYTHFNDYNHFTNNKRTNVLRSPTNKFQICLNCLGLINEQSIKKPMQFIFIMNNCIGTSTLFSFMKN